ncbi:anhydro-N-acetylmuramic acid kinase [Litoribrevibacter euphylliae]|uniref:Anhydro-N-acetylmuramic acid kinase n=1 Tax=Litoribrevibacter euphylliae TaxID=1834034 RepID=A0ABV7HEY7_9GAMM
MASELYLGAMSGTSLDGLDIVLCDFNSKDNILLASHFSPFPKELKSTLYDLSHDETVAINHLYETEQRYSEFCASVVNQFIEQHAIQKLSIKALGLHGQTIRHEPKIPNRFTVQIGDWSKVAALTDITTIGDFRRKDLALGGEGAPLVPPFHQAIFQHPENARIVMNIGGISNITALTPEQQPLGYDTGPGNALLDFWYSKHQSGHYDNQGQWARQGRIIPEILNKLLNEPYFKQAAPKSTGRELFNPEWLTQKLSANSSDSSFEIAPVDLQATLTELTAITTTNEIKQQLTAGEVFICGGGWKNSYLIERIETLLGSSYQVSSTETLGIHPDWVEACAFAWLASNTLNRRDSHQSSTTGASRDAILGGIYYA